MELLIRGQVPAWNGYLILPDQLKFLGAAFLNTDQFVVGVLHGTDKFIQLDLDGCGIARSSY